MIQGVYSRARISNAHVKPRYRRTYTSSVVLLFAISMLLSVNIVRLLHISNTGVTSALQSTTASTKVSNNTTAQPILETQTYAPTSTPPSGAAEDASAIAAVATPAKVPAPVVSTPTQCTGTQYQLPAPQNLTGAPIGLTKSTDQPTYYQVYGNSLSALRTAITNCQYRKAAGSFHATTAYQLNWRYTATSTGNNQCTLSNIRVGLHINQLMPLFVPNGTTPASVTHSWNTYATNLGIHEAGHVDIDTQYAEKLLAALQSMGPVDCSLISRQAQTTIDSYVAMLNAANDLYDSRTNHGATQGAVL